MAAADRAKQITMKKMQVISKQLNMKSYKYHNCEENKTHFP